MRTLSEARQAAAWSKSTAPGYLVEIGFTSISRLSTVGDVPWNGHSWSGNRSLKVLGIRPDGGKIVVGNHDDAFAATVLNEGVADRIIRVWDIDRNTLNPEDPVMVFEGVGDEVEVTTQAVTISLAIGSSRTLFSPRRFVGPSAGFNHLIPTGTVIQTGTVKLTLERA